MPEKFNPRFVDTPGSANSQCSSAYARFKLNIIKYQLKANNLELLKRTEKSNPDHPFVKEAIVNLKKVLEYVFSIFSYSKFFFRMTNEARRKTDNYQHFMEITNDIEDIPVSHKMNIILN